MGSAALARCALRHVSVIGIEQFAPMHEFGASTGESRIIRQAYFEDAAYVPLLLRAYDLWRDLERRTDKHLLRLTGLLMTGNETSEVIAGSRAAARLHDLPVEYLTAGDIRKRFPQLRVQEDEVAVFERAAGVVFPEATIAAHLQIAHAAGAHTRYGVTLEDWTNSNGTVTLRLSDGSQIGARAMILTLGPWFEAQFASLGIPLSIQRNVQVWFAPSNGSYAADSFPAFLLERRDQPLLYGFPDLGAGVKAAFHAYGEITSPAVLRREVDVRADVEPVARALEEWMPGAAHAVLRSKVCMYSLTPDRHFVIDCHPQHRNVVICGGFSGHGYKFASVIGEIAAELALDARTSHDIRFLSLDRFMRTNQA
ncbi:MAG: N-methyl-L-tryptophan oxidase [Candidatus Eremiobacteraeota bacterium]|nr:N-methyl-L-tryptophan oxidase [Candidatus Eremiobacteraeota bacterium]